MISLERRFAKLFRAYERVCEEKAALVRQRDILIEDGQDLEREVRLLKADAATYEKDVTVAFGRYIAMMTYAEQRLVRAGDVEASTKIKDWISYLEDASRS